MIIAPPAVQTCMMISAGLVQFLSCSQSGGVKRNGSAVNELMAADKPFEGGGGEEPGQASC